MTIGKTELLAAAAYRETEVAQYQFNIDGYRLQLTLLPSDEWPEDIAEYKNPSIVVPLELDDDVEDKIAELRHRDRIAQLIRDEKNQQRVAAMALAALKLQLGGDYDAQMAAYRKELLKNA